MAEKNLGPINENELEELSGEKTDVAGGTIVTTAGPVGTILITQLLCPSTKLFCK